MKSNDKYNMLVSEISKSKSRNIYPKTFGMDIQEFKSIIDEIEYDGLFEKGFWALGGFYIFTGLSFKGRSFLENDDKKEYHKIQKTEYNYNNSVTIGGDNSGQIITGNGNNINIEFEKNFNELLNAINNSSLQNKNIVIQELNNKKNNESLLKSYLVSLLQTGVESTVSALIGKLL